MSTIWDKYTKYILKETYNSKFRNIQTRKYKIKRNKNNINKLINKYYERIYKY